MLIKMLPTHSQTELKYTGENKFIHLNKNFPTMRNVPINKEFKEKLLSLAMIIGITNPPGNELLGAIGGWLQEKYFDFTFEEIQHAFSLYAAGEIGDDPGTDFHDRVLKKENSTFNAVFIGSLLNQYRIMRRERMNRAEKTIDASRQLQSKNEVTPEQDALEQWQWYLQRIETENQFDLIGIDYRKVFLHLENTGEIIMTNDEKRVFKEQTKKEGLERIKIQMSRARYENDRERLRSHMDEYNNDILLKNLCCKLQVIEYMNKNRKLK